MLLPSKDFGLVIYNFGQRLPQGQALPAFPDLFHRGKTTQKDKITFCSFSFPRLETQCLALRNHFVGKV